MTDTKASSKSERESVGHLSGNEAQRKFKLGIIINPYAGIGGALALKGSDGKEIREKALAAGAEQQAGAKTRRALLEILDLKDKFEIYTAANDMGESLAKELGLFAHSVYSPKHSQTESEDTLEAARALMQEGIDLLLFAGGDGTARNIFSALGNKVPVLGVPAGCKIHSGVYAITPSGAGKVLKQVIAGELVSLFDAEVKDIDEDKFRQGQVVAKYFGEMQVPAELNYIQAVKSGGKESDELVLEDIAAHVTEMMEEEPERIFVMGSGSTVASIMESQGLENTLLGVDAVQNGEVLAKDLNAQQLLELTEGKAASLVITLIGGQGHIFGRGNQQLSPAFIRNLGKQNIHIVATKTKLNALGQKGLIADTGDAELDQALSGPISVITGYKDKVLYFVRGDEIA